jgi:hypothetical protein
MFFFSFTAATIIGNNGSRKKEYEELSGCAIKINNNPPTEIPHNMQDDRLLFLKGIS